MRQYWDAFQGHAGSDRKREIDVVDPANVSTGDEPVNFGLLIRRQRGGPD